MNELYRFDLSNSNFKDTKLLMCVKVITQLHISELKEIFRS